MSLTIDTKRRLVVALANNQAADEIDNLLGSISIPGVSFYVSATTVALPNGSVASDLNDGLSSLSPFKTITQAISASVGGRGDAIIIAPGSYDEAVVIPRTKLGLTLIGSGGQGIVGIAPSTAGAVALTNHADDVTLINIDTAGNTTAAYGLFSTGSRFRSIDCKHEGADTSGAAVGIGPGSVAQVTAGTAGNCGDIQFIRPEFAWTFNGLAFVASDYGAATQIKVHNAWHHNNSNVCVISVPGAFGIGSVRNLDYKDGTFGRMEDGTKPSDFVKVDDASDTGHFSGNRFALATNAAADLKIGAKVFWSANATEAGWSTARPA